jgi:hypothetical protein
MNSFSKIVPFMNSFLKIVPLWTLFQKSCLLWENVEKYGTAGQPTDDHYACALHAGYVGPHIDTHTHSEYVMLIALPLQHWFSRAHVNATLYGHFFCRFSFFTLHLSYYTYSYVRIFTRDSHIPIALSTKKMHHFAFTCSKLCQDVTVVVVGCYFLLTGRNNRSIEPILTFWHRSFTFKF